MEPGAGGIPGGTDGPRGSGAPPPFATTPLGSWMRASGFLPPPAGGPAPEPGTASELAGAGWRARLLPFIEAAGARNGPCLPAGEDAFLLGDVLLVAPVLREGATERVAPVPAGTWFTFPEGLPVPRDAKAAGMSAPPGAVPMLARAGAAIPLRVPGEHGPPAEVFHLFAGADGGIEPRIRMTTRGTQVQIELAGAADAPGNRLAILHVHGIRQTPDLVSRNGAGEPPRTAPDFTPADWRGWHYDHDRGTAVLAAAGGAATRILISEPPGRERPRVLTAREAPPDAWPDRGFSAILPPDVWIPAPGAGRLPFQARLAATWTAGALAFHGEIRPALPPFRPSGSRQDAEDGFHLILGLAVGDRPATLHLRLAETPEGPRAFVRADGRWAPHPEIRLAAGADGDAWRFTAALPAGRLGPPQLSRGLACPFDFFVQTGSPDGRRGVLQWVQAATRPGDPGGTLALVP